MMLGSYVPVIVVIQLLCEDQRREGVQLLDPVVEISFLLLFFHAFFSGVAHAWHLHQL